MSAPTTSSTPTLPPEDDPYRFGWRYVFAAEGEEPERIPLTLEDVLHPQEDDVIPERPVHALERGYLADVLRSRPLTPPHYAVLSDTLVDWGVPGMRAHSPDIAVFVGLRKPLDVFAGTFALRPSRGRCVLVAEIVSPHTRTNDVVTKLIHYNRARVPLYVILDRLYDGGPATLRGYHRGRKGYEPLSLDTNGRLHLEVLGLLLGVRDNRLVCFAADSGRELGDYVRIAQELDEADRRIREQEQALEEAVQARDDEKRARQAAERKARAAVRKAQAAEREKDAFRERIRELERRLLELPDQTS
jgi:colicin import membrane protein